MASCCACGHGAGRPHPPLTGFFRGTAEGVRLGEGEDVTEGVAEYDTVAVTVAVDEPDVVPVTLPDSDAVAESVAETEVEGVTVGVMEPLIVSLAVPEAVTLSVAEEDGDVVKDGVVDEVTVDVAVTLPVKVTVGVTLLVGLLEATSYRIHSPIPR